MMATATRNWQSENQAHLVAALAGIKTRLRRHAERTGPTEPGENGARGSTANSSPQGEPRMRETDPMRSGFDPAAAPALQRLAATFGLSAFERDVVLLCAGIELDSTVAALCAAAQGDPPSVWPWRHCRMPTGAQCHRKRRCGDGVSLMSGPAQRSRFPPCALRNACCITWRVCQPWTNG
jgi:hypothetical protein